MENPTSRPGDGHRYRNRTMQVSLRFVFVLTGIFAILAAAWSRSPVLAVFVASLLPTTAFVACRKRTRNAFAKLILLFLALLPLYLASYGPSFLLNSYVLYTNPPVTKTEIEKYNEWVKFQGAVFAPMNLCRLSGSTLSRWRYEYINGWMELSDDTVEFLLGFEGNEMET